MRAPTLTGFFDELEKIAQAPGSLAHRMSLGAESPSARASIQNLVGGGGVGGGQEGGGTATAAPPPPPPAPGAGAPSASSMDIPGGDPGIGGGGGPVGGGTPSASDLGIPPSGNPMGGSTQPSTASTPPPPPPPPSGNPASLLGRKGPGTGTLTAEESKEVSGSGKGGGLTASDLGI